MLNCGVHVCPQKCHQLHDHSKVLCTFVIRDQCTKGHKRSWQCHKPPAKACKKCEDEARKVQKEKQKALELEEKRNREEEEHSAHMTKLDALLANERQRIRDQQLSEERVRAINQKEQDLATARRMTIVTQSSLRPPEKGSADTQTRSLATTQESTAMHSAGSDEVSTEHSPSSQQTSGLEWKIQQSPAQLDWRQQKRAENLNNDAIDAIMEMVGLEEVKLQILIIKAKIDASIRQSSDMKQERWNVVFLGNPGTGRLCCVVDKWRKLTLK